MPSTTPIHLVIMQPSGYIHSLGFVDQARYVRHQLRRCGAEVSLAKNRLRQDAVNIVFGAHLGFPMEATQQHPCIFFNLEQLGEGGAKVSQDYLRLLRHSAVVDYDARNVPAYCSVPEDVPIAPFAYAPYLDQPHGLPLEDRPIDLLFFGSMNAKRRAFIDRIEATGVSVTTFDSPIYGPERDHYIRQAKAVVNCSFYESSRFEQVRVSHCLSLGTPVISERNERGMPPDAFMDSVFLLSGQEMDAFFSNTFGTDRFYTQARQKLAHFRTQDPSEPYADLMAFANGFRQGFDQVQSVGPWVPTKINLDTGTDYRLGWLNLGTQDSAQPDLTLDLGNPMVLPLVTQTRHGAQITLSSNSIECIHAGDLPVRTHDLETFMRNAMALLEEGGTLTAEVPHEKAATALLDPRRKRSMSEYSWGYFTEGFWRMGWLTHRFEITELQPLDIHRQPCLNEQPAFIQLTLRKIPTSAKERTRARAMLSDFGGFGDDSQPADAEAAMHALAGLNTSQASAPKRESMPLHPSATANAGTPAPEPAGLVQDMTNECEQIDGLIENDKLSEAMALMANSVNSNFLKPGVAHHSLYYPGFDQRLQTLASVMLDRHALGEQPSTQENHLIIATELYQIGGHSKVLEDFSRELKNPVIVLTDAFGTLHKDPSQLAWIEDRHPHAQVAVLPHSSLWTKAEVLWAFVSRLQPQSITYFNHHQDPVPFVGTLGFKATRKSLVHHCDHNPSLGCTLKDVQHVDITLKLQETCSATLGIPTQILRLHVPDQGVKTFAPMQGQNFSVVTAGRAGKFLREGPLALKEIARHTLSNITGVHVHIGPLPQDWHEDIARHLKSHGLDPRRFVSAGAVSSLWSTLLQLDTAVYIGSAPVSGGRGAIEAQGCGYPVLPFTGFDDGSLLADFSSYANLDLGWSTLDELASRLQGLGDQHPHLSQQARRFYEAHFSHAQFSQTVHQITCD